MGRKKVPKMAPRTSFLRDGAEKGLGDPKRGPRALIKAADPARKVPKRDAKTTPKSIKKVKVIKTRVRF